MKPRRKLPWEEVLGIVLLALLAAWFLHESWRKWADPIIDSGPQWYATWRVSLGDIPYRDFTWNYGPLSILFNGLLFKCFGPGMMVLAAANLVVYAAIAALAYRAFRLAWGALPAFAALAVFVSVFSFSMVNAVGNYNYVLPYATEATHGMLLMLATAFVMVRCCGKKSRGWAFLLGLCGGLAAVLKPEFMLAWGALASAALVMRVRQKQPPSLAECGVALTGVALPTLAFTVWFARVEPWKDAFVHSCRAWWVLLVNQGDTKLVYQDTYVGFDHGWRNVSWELAAALSAVLIVGAIWAAGWFINRPWRPMLRWAMALGAGFLACSVDMGGGFEFGPCLPGLIAIALVIVLFDLRRELRQNGRADAGSLMALALVLLAGAMLARMILRARINHFGFVQAAFAGMVAAAVIVAKVPRWTGPGIWGRRVALAGIAVLLVIGCGAVVAESAKNHAAQSQIVGAGSDRFYAFAPETDQTGMIVNWSAEHMQSVPPDATLLVLPEGVMINYLSRHRRPLREFDGDEESYLNRMREARPDYVIVIWGDERDSGYDRFGDRGQVGAKITDWLKENYVMEDSHHGTNHSRVKWAFIFHRKP